MTINADSNGCISPGECIICNNLLCEAEIGECTCSLNEDGVQTIEGYVCSEKCWESLVKRRQVMPALKVLRDNCFVLAKETIPGQIYTIVSSGITVLRVGNSLNSLPDESRVRFVRIGGDYDSMLLPSDRELTRVNRERVVYE